MTLEVWKTIEIQYPREERKKSKYIFLSPDASSNAKTSIMEQCFKKNGLLIADEFGDNGQIKRSKSSRKKNTPFINKSHNWYL